MIEQHYNHPACIIWGLGNENDWPGDFPEFDKEKIRAFMKELNDLSHSSILHEKPLSAVVIFVKILLMCIRHPSGQAGIAAFIQNTNKSTEEEFKKVNHFLHVEWGGDSHAGRHSESPDKALQNIKATGAPMNVQVMHSYMAARQEFQKMATGAKLTSAIYSTGI